MSCRYDRTTKDYLTDGQPCRHDNDGNPTRHCTGRTTCSNHINPTTRTCTTCIHRTRGTIQQLIDLASLVPTAALDAGIDSDAVSLAGPTADPEAWGHMYASVQANRIPRDRLDLDDGDPETEAKLHPAYLLAWWSWHIRETLELIGTPATDTLTGYAAYITGHLNGLAQHPAGDFPKLGSDVRTCKSHLETVLRNSHAPEKGAPCPTCRDEGNVNRLVREYGHWCEDEDCTRIHHDNDAGDMWRCPANRTEHAWRHEEYSKYLLERRA